jgi:hypothetical protein
MKFIWNGGFEEERIKSLLAEYEEWLKEQKGHFEIYMTSNGGSNSCKDVLVHTINQNPAHFKLYALEKIYSNGFSCFFEVKCHREIFDHTVGMCHIARAELCIKLNGEAYFDDDIFLLKQKKSYEMAVHKFIQNTGMDKKSRDRIINGKDVFFNTSQLRSFLQYQINGTN